MGLKVEKLSFHYPGKKAVLDSFSMKTVSPGITALAGQNGSGKSTILKCINGILKMDDGSIVFNSEEIHNKSPKDRARIMSYVPQSIPESLDFKVYDLILLGRIPHLQWKVSSADRSLVFSILNDLGLEDLCFRYYSELSGGQKQKVLIARALVQEPRLLLMDEGTSNLDLKHQIEILDLLKRFSKEKGMSVLLTAHDLNLVMNYADHIVLLKDGKVAHQGKAAEVLSPEKIYDVFEVPAFVGDHDGQPYVLVENKNG